MIKHEPILSNPNVHYVFYAHLIIYQKGQESQQKLENKEVKVLVTNKKTENYLFIFIILPTFLNKTRKSFPLDNGQNAEIRSHQSVSKAYNPNKKGVINFIRTIVIIVVSVSYAIFINKMPMTALISYFLLKTEGKILQSGAFQNLLSRKYH